jgi:methionine synthase II (cobalamin-independent)
MPLDCQPNLILHILKSKAHARVQESCYHKYNKVLHNTEDLRKEFIQLINQTMQFFEGVPKDQYDGKTMLEAIEIPTTKEENSKEIRAKLQTIKKTV